MSDYREQCVRAKSAKAGIVDQRPVASRSKKAMPVILESRQIEGSIAFRRSRASEWTKWAAYRSEREATQARDNLSRKYARIWEFRIKPEGANEDQPLLDAARAA
jgi:hypothetical protein